MHNFVHHRHKQPTVLLSPRELIVALPPLRSHVNLSRIVRTAACCGVQTIVACGRPKVDPKIARDGSAAVEIIVRRTLPPALTRYQADGYHLVALEQTSGSLSLPEFRFRRRTVLVVGHERLGVDEQTLALVDAVVEIPVYGLPYSHNVATATAIALYEYCRQFPQG
jgi:tRNA G18 (ribose-2'-O)-methylase SpoU